MGMIDWKRCPMSAREARAVAMPEAWRDVLRAEVPVYRHLGPEARARFEDRLRDFVLTKTFSADAGILVDERLRLLIGAGAALLSMNISGETFARLRYVHVYEGTIRDGRHGILGTASGADKVAISHQALCHAFQVPDDGHHVTLHELTHVLDAQWSGFDGVPRLPPGSTSTQRWKEVLERELARLREALANGASPGLPAYAATDTTELFAVATESFFERPVALRDAHPDLYALLVEYYLQDPARAA